MRSRTVFSEAPMYFTGTNYKRKISRNFYGSQTIKLDERNYYGSIFVSSSSGATRLAGPDLSIIYLTDVFAAVS
jgi:hypothetical protein